MARPKRQSRFGEVMGQGFRFGLNEVREPFLDRIGDIGYSCIAFACLEFA